MVKMGLEGPLIQSVSNIVEKMYQLFVEKDLDLVEINPLGISSGGEVMALDGKVSVNDSALGRHQDLIALVNHKSSPEEKQQDTLWQQPTYQGIAPEVAGNGDGVGKRDTLSLQQELGSLKGNIGIICNGEGLTMATLDLVIQSKGKPANFLNLRLNDNREMTNTPSDRLISSLDLVTQDKKVTVVLINIIGTIQPAEELGGAMAEYIKKLSSCNPKIEFVLRLQGSNLDTAKKQLDGLSVEVLENLDEAVSKAVSLAK
jgi:succinyl-CoA synthetase beta subunit